MTQVKVKDIIQRIEQFAPPYLAEEWDPIGLSFGTLDKVVNKLMIALDVDADTIQEAQELGVDLIFTHHPAIFKPLKSLNTENPRRSEYIDLIKSDIAVFSAHTNIDAADFGMSDWLADAIGLPKDREIVFPTYREGYKKLAVYVPEKDVEKVRRALHLAGAGEVGDYQDVSYSIKGQGRFTPQKESDPTVGKIGKEEIVNEVRIEVMFPRQLTTNVINAVQTAHPYEEPVYDLYTLENEKKVYGYGRIAAFEITTEEMLTKVTSELELNGLKYASKNPKKLHKKVAIFGGAGSDYYFDAKQKGATLFITGDVSYHNAQDMLRDGVDVIDAGHYIESVFVSEMHQIINNWKIEENWDLKIYPSKKQKDVFNFK